MYSVITYYNVITIYKEDFMTNIKKLLQILIPGIILAIIVYALFLFFGGKNMYTIGQVSEMFDLPVSTLRYYDKEGLFPELNRTSGIRQFSENEIEALRVIECLKKTGLQIKDIKQFMSWCMEGSSTYTKRKELFENQKKQVEAEITKLNKTLDMLNFKCWYYSEAIKDGNEDRIKSLIPDELPNSIKSAYMNSHKE